MPRTADPTVYETLLDAARAEFARRGVEGARVEDMARRAGISKGAFYLHFRTKQDAFREILQRFLGAIEEHARTRHEAEGRFERERGEREPGGDWDAYCEALDFECRVDAQLLDIMWHNRQILAALDGAGGKGLGRLVADFRRRMRELVTTRVSERQRRGRLRPDVSAEVVADLVVGAYEDYGRRMLEMPEKPDLAAWVRSLLLVIYEGLLAQGAIVAFPPRVAGK